MNKLNMLSRKRRNSAIVMILLLPVVTGDIVLVIKGELPIQEVGLPFILTFAIAAILILRMRRVGGERIEGDERSARIEGRAFAYSWYLTLYVLTLLMLNDRLGLWPISFAQGLLLVLAIMVVTLLVLKSALNRKGDLED